MNAISQALDKVTDAALRVWSNGGFVGSAPIYTQTPRYVDWTPPPRLPNPVWPPLPELAFVLYTIESKHWNGTIKVRKILLDEFGPERAVPFTVWGYLLQEHADEFEAMFERYGRHEVRKEFVNSVRYTRVHAVA